MGLEWLRQRHKISYFTKDFLHDYFSVTQQPLRPEQCKRSISELSHLSPEDTRLSEVLQEGHHVRYRANEISAKYSAVQYLLPSGKMKVSDL